MSRPRAIKIYAAKRALLAEKAFFRRLVIGILCIAWPRKKAIVAGGSLTGHNGQAGTSAVAMPIFPTTSFLAHLF